MCRTETLQLILTPQYIELKKLEALSKNNKVYYGNSIPSIFLDGGNVAASTVVAAATAVDKH